jgi:hypothetical protein
MAMAGGPIAVTFLVLLDTALGQNPFAPPSKPPLGPESNG